MYEIMTVECLNIYCCLKCMKIANIFKTLRNYVKNGNCGVFICVILLSALNLYGRIFINLILGQLVSLYQVFNQSREASCCLEASTEAVRCFKKEDQVDYHLILLLINVLLFSSL